MTAIRKTRPMGSEMEPTENAPLEQWQAWCIKAVRSAEEIDLTSTQRAYAAGKALWFVREGFRAKRAELKDAGKKLKNELSWTRWCKTEKLSSATISRYIAVYTVVLRDPKALHDPLSSFRDLYTPSQVVDEEPLVLGQVRWMKYRKKIDRYIVDQGERVELVKETTEGSLQWKILTGKHKGKTFRPGLYQLSETPINSPPKKKKDKPQLQKVDKPQPPSAAKLPSPPPSVSKSVQKLDRPNLGIVSLPEPELLDHQGVPLKNHQFSEAVQIVVDKLNAIAQEIGDISEISVVERDMLNKAIARVNNALENNQWIPLN